MRGAFNNPDAIFFPIFFIKAYVVDTHLNCVDNLNEYQHDMLL